MKIKKKYEKGLEYIRNVEMKVSPSTTFVADNEDGRAIGRLLDDAVSTPSRTKASVE